MMQLQRKKLQKDSKTLKTADNIDIAMNHYKTDCDSVIVVCHGWFMTKDSRAFSCLSEELAQYFDVISFDFRGHGKSSGCYTFSAKEENDLAVVIDYAKKCGYKNIHLLGFSMGGAQVLNFAAKNPVTSVVAVSPPSDFKKIENHVWKPEAWIPTLFKKFEPKRWCTVRPGSLFHKKTAPVDVVKDITCPTLFILGEKDPIVYPWHTRVLYEKAICPKMLKIFQQGKHAEDLYLEDSENFLKICVDWIKESQNDYR